LHCTGEIDEVLRQAEGSSAAAAGDDPSGSEPREEDTGRTLPLSSPRSTLGMSGGGGDDLLLGVRVTMVEEHLKAIDRKCDRILKELSKVGQAAARR
jgi:hypothetical protein